MSAPSPRKFPFGWPFAGFSVAAAALFLLWPELDLIVSGWFFENGEFHLRKHPVVDFVYSYGELPVRFVGLGAGAVALGLFLAKRTHLGRLSRRALLYVFLAAVIAPGLVVNGVFKEHFGRARPVHVQEFGGDRQFTPPLVITDQCERNCSFVSSHAACGFYFLALGFLFNGWTRRAWFAAGLGAGAVLGVGRILQGGHFLSDILFAAIFVYASAALLHYLMFRREYAALRNAGL
ncbi:MAG: phosphatase PAP2 family protein [Rhodocyclaceae bacterium]|jgi:lipid A 4'-phosphatase|nr:phosphatase PAP2 family protein [Rhodocyclaceae bacterium]